MTTPSSTAATRSQGERRLAVLLFADLSGYTRLCRTLDPEDVAATVLPLLAEVRSAVTDAGGVATGVAGDGFLAVFGVPISGTDIADRALRAAVEMRRVVRSRSAEHSSAVVPDIHIGITAGEVLAYPSDDPSGLSFIGPAINLAARLSDAAPAGCILVDDQCRGLVSDKTAFSAPREIVLQGHEEGVRVWELNDETETRPLAADPPFVGRDDLLGRLDSSWSSARLNEAPCILRVLGEAGIGKSTLLRQWLQRHPARPSVWLNCVDVPFGAHVDELVHQLQQLTNLETDAPRPLTSISPGLLYTHPTENVSVRAREILRQLHHVGHDGVAIVLDDYHEADDELRAIVEALAPARTSAPVLIACLTRSDDSVAPRDGDALVVTRLGDDAVIALATAVIGAPPPPAVADTLVSRAEGRPLAALQSSAYLVESGTVVVRDERCVLAVPSRLSDLPDTMRLFVSGRLDRLPPAEKQLLQELSAIGTRVHVDVVRRLFGDDSSRAVEALVTRGFLVRREDYVGFSHGVVHEVSYASLPRVVRARLHRRVVEENPFDDDGLRALHARRWAASTGETSPVDRQRSAVAALHHTRLHAQRLYTAHVRNAYGEARAARALLEEHAADAPADAAGLMVLLAGCDIHAGRHDDALAGASDAVELCRRHSVDASILTAALCAQGEALSQLRHYQSARQALEEALHVADGAADHVGRGRALRLLGETYRHSDAPRLLALTEEAFDTLSANGDDLGAAEAARTMAYWLSVSAAPKLQRWIDEAERLTPIDDLRGRLELSRTHAMSAAARYLFGTAREQARSCRDVGRELGLDDVARDGLMLGVESAAALGLLDEAMSLLDELHKSATHRSEPRLRQMTAVVGMQPLQRAGQRERAKDALAQALTLRDAFGPPETMMAAAAIGLTARDRGDWAQAVEQLQTAQQAADTSGFSISSLGLRQELVLTTAMLGLPSSDSAEVAELAEAGGAPAVASAAHTAMALVDDTIRLTHAPATLQEAAVRADAAALRLERAGDDAAPAWAASAQQWARLGSTVFLARAQARSGDREAAEQTLQAVGAGDEGRAWALQR